MFVEVRSKEDRELYGGLQLDAKNPIKKNPTKCSSCIHKGFSLTISVQINIFLWIVDVSDRTDQPVVHRHGTLGNYGCRNLWDRFSS